jgi:hypothetical protein
MNSKLSCFAVCALMSAAASAQYCSVHNTTASCANDEYISNVSVGGVSYGSGCVAGGYQDFTSLPPFTMTAGTPFFVSVANFYPGDKVTVWIDLNNDLTFGAGEDIDLPEPANPNGGTVVVGGTAWLPPCTAPALGRRMRVAMSYQTPDPQPACGTPIYGAWHDYTVDIAAPAVGDTCFCPLTATVGANVGAVADGTPDGSPCGPAIPNAWYAFTPATTNHYEMTTYGFPFIAGVYTGSCSNLTSVACPFSDSAIVPMTAGVTYYVEVSDWASSVFVLAIVAVPPAVNDECSGALPIFAGVTSGVSNVYASDSLEPACATFSKDLWYAYTASCDGIHTFRTCGHSVDDTLLALYDSCGGAQIGCDDDGCGIRSTMSVALAAGSTYYLRLGGWPGGATNTAIEIVPPAAALSFPTTPGFLSMSVCGGTPFGGYFTAVTAYQGAFPNGSFFGIDITLLELFLQIGAGPPFVGLLDGDGDALHGPYAVPPGLTLYGVTLNNVFVPGFKASAPMSVTTI